MKELMWRLEEYVRVFKGIPMKFLFSSFFQELKLNFWGHTSNVLCCFDKIKFNLKEVHYKYDTTTVQNL